MRIGVKINMRPVHIVIGLLLFFLVVSSAAILYSTAQNRDAVEGLALQALQSTAFAIASSAESALMTSAWSDAREIREIFSDRVVAYALIARADGEISFHTNRFLVGSSLPANEIDRFLKTGLSSGKRVNLQTGVSAYQFDYMLHNPEGRPELLRLVLHTTPADKIISGARKVWWTALVVLLLLWTTGVTLSLMLTRYLRLQTEVEKGRQMSLIGQMTAVLAHEIRNALTSIKGFAQLADEKTPQSDEKKPALAAVLTGTDRIESLVNDLLLFSRNEEYNMSVVDVAQIIREEAHLSVHSWKGTVEFAGEGPVYANADEAKLRRVIGNGIMNALEAMGGTGTLRFSTGNESRWATISIEDTGAGLSEKVKEHLFEPFRTTKVNGTGLGLAYSEKVVEGMGGRIALSEKGHALKGAVLTIRLPAAQKGGS
jgi:two-component system, NtrC family, sensor histidine kinase HydH